MNKSNLVALIICAIVAAGLWALVGGPGGPAILTPRDDNASTTPGDDELSVDSSDAPPAQRSLDIDGSIAHPAAAPETEGRWLRVVEAQSGETLTTPVQVRFVAETRTIHNAGSDDGNLEIPVALDGSAVVWVSASGSLHRFPSRTYPEGVSTLEITAASPIDLRFIGDGARVMERPEVEDLYRQAGIEIEGRWIEGGRFASTGVLSHFIRPYEDLWGLLSAQ